MRHLALGLVVAGVLGIMGTNHVVASNNPQPQITVVEKSAQSVPQSKLTIMGIEVPFYWGPGWNPVTGEWTSCLYSDITHRAVFCY